PLGAASGAGHDPSVSADVAGSHGSYSYRGPLSAEPMADSGSDGSLAAAVSSLQAAINGYLSAALDARVAQRKSDAIFCEFEETEAASEVAQQTFDVTGSPAAYDAVQQAHRR